MENNHAIKFGVFAGIGTVMFLFLFYWIDRPLMLSPSIIWSTMLLYFIGMYMAPLEERKENGGYISFKPAMKSAFLVFVIANGIYHFYNYALYNFIDTEMLSIQQEFMRENMVVLENVFTKEQYETFKESIEVLNFNLITVISNFLLSLFFGFLIAAIIAKLIKIEPPIETENV